MKRFEVAIDIVVEASSPEDAADKALRYLRSSSAVSVGVTEVDAHGEPMDDGTVIEAVSPYFNNTTRH